MICPKCKNPYLFIDKENENMSHCLRCSYEEPFKHPEYSTYHEDKYTKKEYNRNIQTDPQMRFILKKLELSEKDKVVDIGCGVGDYTTEIAKISKGVTGVDLNVNSAKNKHPHISFMEYNCNNPLPFKDKSIDKVISINLIEHLVAYDKFLFECNRILAPGGKIAVTTANLDFFMHKYFFDTTHVHEWTLKEFEKIMGKYFSVDIIKKSSSMFNYFPFNIFMTKFIKPDILFIGTKK